MVLEEIPLFNGKIDPKVVMEWIEGMENYFECEGISEAQKVKVAKSRIRGSTLTWWKFVQLKREKEVKHPIDTRKGMEDKVKQKKNLEDYKIKLHKKRKNLRQRDLDVNFCTKEFQNLCLRYKVQEDERIKVDR